MKSIKIPALFLLLVLINLFNPQMSLAQNNLSTITGKIVTADGTAAG